MGTNLTKMSFNQGYGRLDPSLPAEVWGTSVLGWGCQPWQTSKAALAQIVWIELFSFSESTAWKTPAIKWLCSMTTMKTVAPVRFSKGEIKRVEDNLWAQKFPMRKFKDPLDRPSSSPAGPLIRCFAFWLETLKVLSRHSYSSILVS